jgi:hypothetical protein
MVRFFQTDELVPGVVLSLLPDIARPIFTNPATGKTTSQRSTNAITQKVSIITLSILETYGDFTEVSYSTLA